MNHYSNMPALPEEMHSDEPEMEEEETTVKYPEMVADFKRWITSKSDVIEAESSKMADNSFLNHLKSQCHPDRPDHLIPEIGLETTACSLWQLPHSASIQVGWRSVAQLCSSQCSFC